MNQLEMTKKQLLKKRNSLFRYLQDLDKENTFWRDGVTINTKRLVNGYVGLEKGRIDTKLFTKRKVQNKIKAGFSLASDHSYSLTGGYWNSYWAEICYLIGGIHSLADRMGIKSVSGLVRFERDYSLEGNYSTPNVPHVSVALDQHTRWKDEYLEQLLSCRPNGGTSLISYAEAAIDMALQLEDVTHRVAFFLTDGDCDEKVYLESLRLQAKSMGVHLVGIGLGVDGTGLPNGIEGRNAVEIAEKMVDCIVEVLKNA